MDLEALALAVDERVRVPGAERRLARLYGVHVRDGADLEDGLRLDILAEGEGRKIPKTARPPSGVTAIALATNAWAAPMEEDGTVSLRPSLHPERRRVHVTLVVGNAGAVSILRYGDGEPTVLRGGVGIVHERMVGCWARRWRSVADASPGGSAA